MKDTPIEEVIPDLWGRHFEDRALFEFDTEEEAEGFCEWAIRTEGKNFQKLGKVVIVPYGVGFSQRSMNEMASDYLEIEAVKGSGKK